MIDSPPAMKSTYRLAFATLVVSSSVAMSGCGGSSGGGGSTAAGPRVSLLGAPAGLRSDATGFNAAGSPVYSVADISGTGWTVYGANGQALYDMQIPSVTSSEPEGVSGKFVVGDYSGPNGQGIVLASENADGSVSSTQFPGYGFVACDSGEALVTNPGSPTAYSVIDLATGAVTPEPALAGDPRPSLKGGFVLYGGSSPKVLDAATGASVALQAAQGSDGSIGTLAVNSSGQALGFSKAGGIEQLRVWSATGVPGGVLDSTLSTETFAIGWAGSPAFRELSKRMPAKPERRTSTYSISNSVDSLTAMPMWR